MKTTSANLIPWVLTVFCLNFAFASKPIKQPQQVASVEEKSPRYEASTTEAAPPAKYDRASGLLGMKILDPKDEYLGRIKDVVFDFKSERVAYVVMAVNTMGITAFQEKLLAVPLTALTISSDATHFVLPAEKEKIELAGGIGIDPKQWPSATSPSWGAQPFWQKDDANTDNSKSEEKPAKSNDYEPKSSSSPDEK